MTFEWPWQYTFPPFFTLQPNVETRKKQLDAWCSLVLAYYAHHKKYSIDVVESLSSELFLNKSINRKLNSESVYVILDILAKRGNLEWKDKTKKQALLMWRTPEQWGKLIYDWVSQNGMNNTVCTFYELVNGDNTSGEAFHGLDTETLTKALQALALQKKAEIMSFDGNEGVKFF